MQSSIAIIKYRNVWNTKSESISTISCHNTHRDNSIKHLNYFSDSARSSCLLYVLLLRNCVANLNRPSVTPNTHTCARAYTAHVYSDEGRVYKIQSPVLFLNSSNAEAACNFPTKLRHVTLLQINPPANRRPSPFYPAHAHRITNGRYT